jgi:catechol 2,3-dioxygenase
MAGRTTDAENSRQPYGIAPPGYRLPDETHVGRVRLQVSDLERSLAYYRDVVGFRALQQSADRAVLGAEGDDRPLVELVERPGATAVPRRGRIGLYHFAILLPARAALGRFLGHLAQIGVRAGMSDHFVSEAIYLQDPDGNGIELYWDRPQEAWPRTPDGQLQMFTQALDLNALLREAHG